MINVFRSLNYYVRKDLAIVIALISIVSMPLLAMWFMRALDGMELSDMTGASYFTGVNGDVVVICMIAVMVIVIRLVGSDMSDKSVNYEILGGNRRIKAYLGRIAAGLLWGTVICWALMSMPIGYLTLINGWGNNVDMKWALIRQFLMFLPLLRMVSLFIFLTFLVGSAGKGMALAFVIIEAEAIFDMIAYEVLDIELKYAFFTSSISQIMRVDNAKSIVVDGKQVSFYLAELPAEQIWKTAAVSLIAATLYLTGAAVLFIRKDRN